MPETYQRKLAYPLLHPFYTGVWIVIIPMTVPSVLLNVFGASKYIQAKSVCFIVLAIYAPNPTSVEQFIKSDHKILVSQDLFQNLNPYITQKLAEKVILSKEKVEFNLTDSRHSYVMACSTGKQLIAWQQYNDRQRLKNWRRRFYMIDEKLFLS